MLFILQFLIGHNIKNIVFDLGGVIIGLDTNRTNEAFASMSGQSVQDVISKFSGESFFIEYEKGLITDEEFRDRIRTSIKQNSSDQQIDNAWNAMLLSIAKEKYSLLLKLKNQYRTFLLSNTNNIHLTAVNEIVLQTEDNPDLGDYFHKTYYSHVMRMRKPDQEIFEQVLNENKLEASQTLFLDDNIDNVKSAQSLGIRSIQITSIDMILSLFA